MSTIMKLVALSASALVLTAVVALWVFSANADAQSPKKAFLDALPGDIEVQESTDGSMIGILVPGDHKNANKILNDFKKMTSEKKQNPKDGKSEPVEYSANGDSLCPGGRDPDLAESSTERGLYAANIGDDRFRFAENEPAWTISAVFHCDEGIDAYAIAQTTFGNGYTVGYFYDPVSGVDRRESVGWKDCRSTWCYWFVLADPRNYEYVDWIQTYWSSAVNYTQWGCLP